MCDKQTRIDEAPAKQSSEGTEPRGHGGCPCEPKRCLPAAGAVMAAVAVVLLIGVRKRSNRNKARTQSPHPAGCCA